MSCTVSEDKTVQQSCNCIEIREEQYSSNGVSYSTWQQIGLRPTLFSCDQNGYIYQQDGFAYNGLFYKQRTRVECK